MTDTNTYFASGGAAFTSTSDNWGTPQSFYDEMHKEFGFGLDVCASTTNHKAPEWYGLDHPNTFRRDGLARDWAVDAKGKPVWMNPPYGRGIDKWMHKAIEASDKGATVVCLVPSRTDTRWFQDFAFARQQVGRAEVRFIRGRLKFGDGKNSAPFPSAVVVFHPPAKP